MPHIVAKRSSKDAAIKEGVKIKKLLGSKAKITVKKYNERLWGVYME